MNEKILHLTLKKQWFNMILSGEKTEEYREIKPYWIDRFIIDRENGLSVSKQPVNGLFDRLEDDKRNYYFLRGYLSTSEYKRADIVNYMLDKTSKYNDFTHIIFRNGYGLDKPSFKIELNGIEIGVGEEEWGAPKEKVFILKLGKIINNKPTH